MSCNCGAISGMVTHPSQTVTIVTLSGIWLVLPLDPRFTGSNLAEGDKNLQYACFSRGNKAVGSMSLRIYVMLKNPLKYETDTL
jgi:hypothetical protein